MRDSIALIPCRGGSKGIPRKNVQKVGGVPLVVRTIETAKLAEVQRIIVSTDDEEISELASEAGAEIIHRPVELASDDASTQSVIVHAVTELLSQGASIQSPFFLLQATSPFLSSDTLKQMLKSSDFSTPFLRFTAVEWHGVLWQSIDNEISPYGHSRATRQRRQDMKTILRETGAAYLSRLGDEIIEKVRTTRDLQVHLTSLIESLEIDSVEDLELCRRLALKLD